MDILSVPWRILEPWFALPFLNFPTPGLKKLKPEWEKTAADILALLPSGNVGLVVPTGGGKTVIATLVILGGPYRTLFTAPTRPLTHQQRQRTCYQIRGTMRGTRMITGESGTRERVWDDPEDLVVFATPETVLSALGAGRAALEHFELLIIDEFHYARGRYAYVPLAKAAHDHGVKILALSASPGGTWDEIAAAKDACHLSHLLAVDIETGKKVRSLVTAPPTPALLEIKELLGTLMSNRAARIRDAGVPVDTVHTLTIPRLEHLATRINQLPRRDTFEEVQYRAASVAHTTYRLLSYLRATALTESYHTFLAAVQEHIANPTHRKRSIARRWIWEQPQTQRAVAIAGAEHDHHPKLKRAVEVIASFCGMERSALTFVGSKETGHYLRAVLTKQRLRVEVVFGGKDRNLTRQEAVLDALGARQLDLVIATSVIEPGISVPDVSGVFQYSLPLTGVSRIQRRGRTARLPGTTGCDIYFALDDPIDLARYWKTLRSTQRIDRLVSANRLTDLPLFAGTCS